MLTGTDGDALSIEQCADVVRVDVFEDERDDPGLLAGGPDDPPSDWEGLLYRDPKTKAILTSPANMETILQYHDDWREVLTYDGMSCRTIKRRAPAYPGGEARHCVPGYGGCHRIACFH